jgi:Uma2 family endonuclease
MDFKSLHMIDKLNLPFPWETNARGQIIMTPHGYDHSFRISKLIRIFAEIKPEWHCGYQLGIFTADGLKGPDVTLASTVYHARHVNYKGYVNEAPEICIEVMSPSNSWQEMLDKMPLYFEVGALEVWIVDVDGNISFFSPGNEQLPQSRLIPDAPQSI